MLSQDSGGWTGTLPMAKMPRPPVVTLESPKACSIAGKTGTTAAILKPWSLTLLPEDP